MYRVGMRVILKLSEKEKCTKINGQLFDLLCSICSKKSQKITLIHRHLNHIFLKNF